VQPSTLRCLRRLALGAAAAGLVGCAATDASPVRLGLAGPLTDPVGRPMLLAAQMAVEEINAAGGVNGRRLELVSYDDHGDTDSALAVATRLYDSDVRAVVGHVFSGTTMSAAPVYNGGTDPLVELTPSSSAPGVRALGDYTFRICPSDLAHGQALARWAKNDLHHDAGTVFYLNEEYGRGIRQAFVEEYQRLGGTIEAVNPYLGGTPDLGPYLDRLAKTGRSKFMLVAGNLSEGQAVLKQARARGIPLPILGGDGLEGLESSGAIADGSYETSAYVPTIGTTANRRFVEAYRAKYPEAGQPNQPAAGAYDAVYLLVDVMRQAGTGRRQIRDGLAARTGNHAFEGVTGRIAFDSAGDLAGGSVYILQVRNGALQLEGKR
jgi:branched-chain amino acid transport system substrate-binding protein